MTLGEPAERVPGRPILNPFRASVNGLAVSA
jgi:hypothetical protein